MGAVVSEYSGLRYRTHTEVYAPHDDTWLLVDAVRTFGSLAGKTVLEVGCGAGLGVIAAATAGARAVATDRNFEALRLTRENAGLNDVAVATVRADLAAGVDLSAVDLLLFNPPYLPTDPHERLPGDLNLAFDGGPTGNETLFRFAVMLEEHAIQGGRVPSLVLVTSSLNDRHALKVRLAAAGLGVVTELGTAAFPFERLYAERFDARLTTVKDI